MILLGSLGGDSFVGAAQFFGGFFSGFTRFAQQPFADLMQVVGEDS